MKDIRLIILFLFSTISCFSQQTILIDTSIYNNSTFKPLRDCQKLLNYRPEDSLCAQIIRSYQFDENGNVGKILNSHKGTDTDTTLAILHYDKDNKQINRINFDKVNGDTLIDGSKVLYFYNKNGLLIKKVCLDIIVAKQIYDTLFVQEFSYNTKGQKATENLRNVEDWMMSTGLQKFKYDEKGRLKEIERIATTGANSAKKRPEDNYTVYYTYFGDTAYKETQVFNLINKEHNTFWEQTYFKDKSGKTIKTVRTFVQHVEIKYLNGKYIPDPESKDANIQSKTNYYEYDNLGRISKCSTAFDYEDKSPVWKNHSEWVTFFKYKDNQVYTLPEDEYIEED